MGKTTGKTKKPDRTGSPDGALLHVWKRQKRRETFRMEELFQASKINAALERLHIKLENLPDVRNVRSLLTEGYTVSTPAFPCLLQTKLQTVCCPTCLAEFRGLGSIGYKEPGFFLHCVGECESYVRSGRIRKCDDCKLLLLNQEYLDLHNRTNHMNEMVKMRRKKCRSVSSQ